MSGDAEILWAAAAVPLVGVMVRACARWAGGGSPAWLLLGVACGAGGVDGLRTLAARLRWVPLSPQVQQGLWGLVGGALVWALWREWRALGRAPAPEPSPVALHEGGQGGGPPPSSPPSP